MTSGSVMRQDPGLRQGYGSGLGGRESANLGDILERVLDKGLVIAGDIQVNLLDIELLTIRLRLVIASLDTAREVGINWWEYDPWLSGDAQARQVANGGEQELQYRSRKLEEENRRLRGRLAALEGGDRTDE